MGSQPASFISISIPTQADNFDTEARIVDEEFDDIGLELFDAKESQNNEIELQQDGS